MYQSEELLTMSKKEEQYMQFIEHIKALKTSQKAAADKLNISTRHLRRLTRSYEKLGAAGIVSKRRGKIGNRHYTDTFKQQVMKQVRAHYSDFGPTFACEKLAQRNELTVSRETLRKWMIEAGLWKPKIPRLLHTHQQRHRRSQRGELIQVDGSVHDWFEGRCDICSLLVFIDDATSELMFMRFVPSESMASYFTAIHDYIKQHGRPMAFYTDKHSVFHVNAKEAQSGSGETQCGRALNELDIQLICANSPQAKGRVERANGTLQDRLVKEMRLAKISDVDTANAYLSTFITEHNKRFAKAPANPVDAHRHELPDQTTLNAIFSIQVQRTISKNLEVSYDNSIYQIQTMKPSYNMRKAKILVCDHQGEITLIYKGHELKYDVFDKHNRPAPEVSKKELQQATQSKKRRPSNDHPWKKYPVRQTA